MDNISIYLLATLINDGISSVTIVTTDILNNTDMETSALSNLDLIMGKMYFWMTGLTSILSITGSLLIIAIYILMPDIRSSGEL